MQKHNIVISNMYFLSDCQKGQFINPLNELKTELIIIIIIYRDFFPH